MACFAFASIAYLIFIFVAVSSPAIAQGAVSLRGWGDYKFGMTIAQALAVPGTQRDEAGAECPRKLRLRRDCPAVEWVRMRAISPVVIGGKEFAVELAFHRNRIRHIDLKHESADVVAGCEGQFLSALAEVGRRHGALLAGDLGVEFRASPGFSFSNFQSGQSGYGHWIRDEGVTEFSYTGATVRRNVWAARGSFTDGQVEVRATHDVDYKFRFGADGLKLDRELPGWSGLCRVQVLYRGAIHPLPHPRAASPNER